MVREQLGNIGNSLVMRPVDRIRVDRRVDRRTVGCQRRKEVAGRRWPEGGGMPSKVTPIIRGMPRLGKR